MSNLIHEATSAEVLAEVFRLEQQRFDVPASSDAPFIKEKVVYGKVGTRELIGTLYLPKKSSKTPRPSVVYIHGGGWKGGTRAQFPRHAAAMTAKGFAGLCIGYRLSGEAPCPAAIQDCKCAVRYLRANAREFNLDSNRMGAAGGSAGGHLSAILATTSDRAEWEGDGGYAEFSSTIQAAVLFNGVFDLVTWWQYGKYNDLMIEFFGKTYEQDPALYRLASPITHVNKHTPPCLLIHGEEDEAVPIQQSVDFYERIRAVGGQTELIRVPLVGHGWFNADPHLEPHLRQMMDFFVKHLG